MRSLIAALCTFFSVQAFASTVDSIGVENNNGHQVILHKVAAKETYYSIGRLYNVPPKEIISYNNNISLGIGTMLKVPTQRAYGTQTAKATKPPETKQAKAEPAKKEPVKSSPVVEPSSEIIEYKVGPKETLFAIARKFGTTIGEIKQLNNLSGYSLSVGQVLKIKQSNSSDQTVTTTANSETTSPAKSSNTPATEETENGMEVPESTAKPEKTKSKTGRLGVTERNERGIAVWFEDESLDSTKMLALHRSAPIGTIIKITNPMTDRTTFVKVVGKFTDNETTRDAIIVLTKATADLLGALDKRFLVSIDYGMPNE
ncbi:septal ring lytic transglycosylase RlpA family protein [Desertivirga arenae]|uniref:septal ring lytic transglycosylase RlpA family protein n=1 Tax=Desertivirga arenae TaxID=2810309 RepID=UPI001A977803|nr:LysM peptidoglycan-binding domain-containing protein [Pedobacter sp. SYSU D00823]